MIKSELRKKYKLLREELSDVQIDNYSLKIANQLLKMPIWDKTYYHIFLPITSKKEVDTHCITPILMGKNKHLVVSVSNFETLTLQHILWTEDTRFTLNSYNIPEPVLQPNSLLVAPEVIDLVFVPLLAYDTQGNRIGYGKGFYDQFLKQCNPNVLKIGLSFFEPEPYIDDISPLDVSLNYVITPHTIHCFE